MKQLLFTIILSGIFSLIIRAADTCGLNRLYVAYTPQFDINRLNIKNNSIEPDIIHARNTLGQYASLGLERITRYGLIIRAGVGLCKRVHDISIVKDFHNYDPDATLDFVKTYPIRISINSIDPELMLGYHRRLINNWAIVGQVGMQQKRYDAVVHNRQDPLVSYYNNKSELQLTEPFFYEVWMGNPPPPIPSGGWFDVLFAHVLIFKCYCGLEYAFPRGVVKYLSIGLEVTSTGAWNSNSQEMEVTSDKHRDADINTSFYIDRAVSLGLRVSAGFWR